MISCALTAVFWIGSAGLDPGVASADQPVSVVIPDEEECTECSVERYLVTTINDQGFPGGALEDIPFPHYLSDGRYFVSDGSRLYFTDRGGKIVRQVGREGEGPGEYTFPQFVLESSDAYLVVDTHGSRVTRLKKESLELLDTYNLPPGSSRARPVVFSDGTLVVSASFPTRGRAGPDLHVISPEGEILRSFGTYSGGEEPRYLAASGDTAFWSAPPHEPVITLWSRSGRMLRVVERQAAWFRPPDQDTKAGDSFTALSGLYEDPRGLLWIHVHRLVRSSSGGTDPNSGDNASIVEVLDIGTSTLAATWVLPRVRQYLMSGGQTFERAHAPTGERLVHVWGYRLRRGLSHTMRPAAPPRLRVYQRTHEASGER